MSRAKKWCSKERQFDTVESVAMGIKVKRMELVRLVIRIAYSVKMICVWSVKVKEFYSLMVLVEKLLKIVKLNLSFIQLQSIRNLLVLYVRKVKHLILILLNVNYVKILAARLVIIMENVSHVTQIFSFGTVFVFRLMKTVLQNHFLNTSSLILTLSVLIVRMNTIKMRKENALWNSKINSLNVPSVQMMDFDAIDVRLVIILVFSVLVSRQRLIIVQSSMKTSTGSTQAQNNAKNVRLRIVLSAELKVNVFNVLKACSQPNLVSDVDLSLKAVQMKTML